VKKLCTESDFVISNDSKVDVKITGKIIKLRYMPIKNNEITIKKLNDKEYLNLITGEVLTYKVIETRDQNFDNVKASIEKLRDFVNTNITEKYRVHWITLTYRQRDSIDEEAVPMRDTKKLYLDFKHCIQAIRRDYPNCTIEYIAVAEPQKTGSWHLHLLLIWDRKAPFLDPSIFTARYWSHGFIVVQHISDNCDNIGAYFSAYLCDLEYNEGDKLEEGETIKTALNSKKQSKKYIKGGRLKFYPAGMNLYRCSRGIKKPIEKEMLYSDFKKQNFGTLTYKNSVVLYDEKTDKTVDICYEYYNQDRKSTDVRKFTDRDKFNNITDKLQMIKGLKND